MPVACNSNALTGSSGAVYYTPAGTKACLLAADFTTGGVITVTSQNDFRVGDPIKFEETGGATIDTGFDVSKAYVVSAVDVAANTVTVTEADGTGVTVANDGDDGGGHIEMFFNPAAGICEAREWTVSMTRESLDVTTLPCSPNSSKGGQRWAATKRFQPGYAEVTGTITLYISSDSQALANRLMESTFLNSQDGASVKLYMDLESDGSTPPQPNDAASKHIAGDVNFTDFSTGVNPDDPTQAEVSFTMFNITHWIGQVVS